MRRVVLTVVAVATLAFAGVTAALANPNDPVVDDTLSGGPFSGGVAGRGSVTITRVYPNSKTGCITLRLRILGWAMLPGQVGSPVNSPSGGHYHVYVNGKYRSFGTNANRARACGLATGRSHSLRVVLANNNHRELRARSQLVTAVLR